MNRTASELVLQARRLVFVLNAVVWSLLLVGVAMAQTAACTGSGVVTGPGAPSGAQVWVTDSADAFNQQTNAQNALASSLGCTVTDRWGRQSSQVNATFGSCAISANDGTYTWTDAANPCDMSLPLATGGGSGSAWPADVVAWALVGFLGMFMGGLAVGLIHRSIIRLAEAVQ